MFWNWWYTKEKPLVSYPSFGGGVGSLLRTSGGPGTEATGGTTTSEGIAPGNGYRYHVFTAPGTFTLVSGADINIEYLVVAGGGSGGDGHGGGGGAGGMLNNVSGDP